MNNVLKKETFVYVHMAAKETNRTSRSFCIAIVLGF